MAKIDDVKQAVDRYASATIEWDGRCKKIGRDIVRGFATYLEVGEDYVLPVVPIGDFRPVNYHDQAFSNFGNLLDLAPILFGVAIRVDHTKDDGHFWLRLVIEMVRKHSSAEIHLEDGGKVELPAQYDQKQLETLFENMLQNILSIFGVGALTTKNSFGFDLTPIGGKAGTPEEKKATDG